MSEKEKPGFNFDVGLKAEIKATLPETSAGRALDAVVDIIRPLSEWTGLKADQIRLRREDVLFEIAAKAQKRLRLEQKPLVPIPLKFLVPYIENASNEEPDSALLDWWAALLVSAAQGQGRHPVLVDIMSKLTGREAQYLNSLWTMLEGDSKGTKRTTADVADFFLRHIAMMGTSGDIGKLQPEEFRQAAEKICLECCEIAKGRGIFPRFLQYPTDKFVGGSARFDERDSGVIDICLAAGVLEGVRVTVNVPSPFISPSNASVEAVVFSAGGLQLMQAVHGFVS